MKCLAKVMCSVLVVISGQACSMAAWRFKQIGVGAGLVSVGVVGKVAYHEHKAREARNKLIEDYKALWAVRLMHSNLACKQTPELGPAFVDTYKKMILPLEHDIRQLHDHNPWAWFSNRNGYYDQVTEVAQAMKEIEKNNEVAKVPAENRARCYR